MRDTQRLYSVHFLRFFASVAVVVHHVISRYDPKLIVGAAGVDMFFIISGLVIGLAMRSGETASAFAARRMIRIYPIYWVATFLYAAFRIWVWTEHPSALEVAGSLVIFPVFGAAWHPIYWPAWTLEYEVFFYALATVLIATCRHRAMLVCFIILVLLSFLQIKIPDTNPVQYFNLGRFIEFATGLLLAYSIERKLFVNKTIGAILIGTAVCMLYYNRELPYDQRLAWGVPSLMAIVGLLAFEESRFLRHSMVKLGGNASYSIYLTHITVIELIYVVAYKLGVNVDRFSSANATIYSLFCIVAALVVGLVIHLSIEKPLLELLRSRFLTPMELQRQIG